MADCGLLNFTTCLPQVFFEYIVGLLNSPLQPLLTLTKDLITAVQAALAAAPKSATILFSPGFTSFGLFVNEFDRGKQFNQIVK